MSVQNVVINFTKAGHKGMLIESRRPESGGEWLLLAIETTSPYVDERPLLAPPTPEVREYRMRFWDGGEGTGKWSAVKRVTVK